MRDGVSPTRDLDETGRSIEIDAVGDVRGYFGEA